MNRVHNKPYNNSNWKKLREKQLSLFPFCNVCNDTNNLQVDHIFEFKTNNSLFYNLNNLQTLCIKCHGYKSSLEFLVSKLKVGNWELIVDENLEDTMLITLINYYGNDHLAVDYYVNNTTLFKRFVLKTKNLKLNTIRLLLSKIYLKFNSFPYIINIDNAKTLSNYFEL